MERLKKFCLFYIFLFSQIFILSVCYASSSFVISSIKVEGLQRIEKGVVYNALPVRVGDRITSKQTSDIIYKLYQSQLFSDIKVYHDGSVLIIKVKERPSIGVLEIKGNKDIKTEDLLDGLKSIGLSEGAPFDQLKLDQVREELQNTYYAQGKYAAKITTNVTQLSRNRVKIIINVKEGAAAKIKRITIIGNNYFSQKEIMKKFNLSSSGLLTWFTGSDQYTKQKLEGDLEALRSFYLDRGYIKFKILSKKVSMSHNKADIYITIKIKEGPRYRFGAYKVTNNTLIKKEQLKKLIVVRPGDVFSNKDVMKTVYNINNVLGNKGYAYSKVDVQDQVNESNKTVSLNFIENIGSRIYVRRINFSGNNVTQSNVLRREMTQMEGSWASRQNITDSRIKLMRLGFFKSADIQSVPVVGANNQIDLDVKVKEQFSGKFEAGIGYSQVDGINYKIGVTQSNFAGTGNLVSFLFNKNSASSQYQINYNNPYYTPEGVSRGFNLAYQNTNLADLGVSDYLRDTASAGISYGIPISKDSRLTANLGYERDTIKVPNIANASIELKELICGSNFNCGQNQKSFDTGKVNLGWSNVTLDKAVFPVLGASQYLYGLITIPGSNLEYYKVGYKGSYFHPIYKEKYIFNIHGNLGYGGVYNKTEYYPVFQNFYAGGPGSVRGFEANSLGPRDDNDNALGGNALVYGSAEVIFPTPMIETDTIRNSVFVDGGNVFAIHEDPEVGGGSLRFSAGVSLQWLSPIGQLVFSLAEPINKKPGDKTEIFQFNMGGVF